ncbi:MAG: HD domain-containing protein [Treponema sp.]|nr:HD domain-containing protein [Treponema sp.]
MRGVKIPCELQKMNSLFEEAGFEAYLVGGAVRDEIMGKGAHDWDIATNARPEDVMKIFHRVIPTGIKHGTVTVHFMKKAIEVTTFRTESDYSDGRHPDKVEYAGHIEEDLSRRDFTMNAMAASLKDGHIVDPYGGADDIKARVIRAVGVPHERFMEDGLRPVRAVRFASQLGFRIEENTWAAILRPDILKKAAGISLERFRDEFCKILLSPVPSVGLKLLEESGLLKIFVPELLQGRACVQSDERGFHSFDVLDHNFYACDGAVLRGALSCSGLPRTSFAQEIPASDRLLILRLAALFHDVAKPSCKRVDGGKITFYNHEIAGEKMARGILVRLKFSNAQIDAVCHLIKEHMFNYESSWSDAAVRRFVQRVGAQNIDALFDLRLADIYGMKRVEVRLHDTAVCGKLLELRSRVDAALSQKSAMGLKDLAVNGGDLIALGIPAGKKMGAILKELFEAVTDDPAMNSRDALLGLAKNLWTEKYSG